MPTRYRGMVVAAASPSGRGEAITPAVVRDARAVMQVVEQLRAAGCAAAAGRRGRWYEITAGRGATAVRVIYRRPDGWWVARQPGAGVDAWEYALPVESVVPVVCARVEFELAAVRDGERPASRTTVPHPPTG